MNTKHLLITLFVSLMAVSASAEVVYEPLIVDSGFNRDVIAEVATSDGHINSSVAQSPIVLNSLGSVDSCFGTDSVIAKVNADDFDQTSEYWKAEYDLTVSCGWPTDFGNPEDRIIRCIEDAKDNYSDPDVFFHLAPYNERNALCLRPNSGGVTYQGTGTLKFRKIGCYDKIFFLFVSMKKGDDGSDRRVNTKVYYTDGTHTDTLFRFAGLGGEVGRRVHKTNIYESGIFKKHTHKEEKVNLANASVFDIPVDNTKLIERIVFENPKINSAAIVLGVTGRTADMEIPSEEASVTSDINDNSFEACWEAIEEATSYRLDVATDIDFQHILEDYNNKVINGKLNTCQEVANLAAENDYYWRVRSVNSAGGQSASSAPKRVRTQATTGPQATEDTRSSIQSEMTALLNTTTNLIIYRTLWKDGYFNTLCLPFNLDEAGIAASPLAGCELFTFNHADVIGSSQLDIHMDEATTIEAGVPYLIKWPNSGTTINNLLFNGVTITTDQGQTVGEEGQVQFVGNVACAALEQDNHNILFVGANNTLYWPNTDLGLKGFRAHFEVPTQGNAAVRQGTPARLVLGHNVATGVENISNEEIGKCENAKILRDGQLFILREGQLYNAQGQLVK